MCTTPLHSAYHSDVCSSALIRQLITLTLVLAMKVQMSIKDVSVFNENKKRRNQICLQSISILLNISDEKMINLLFSYIHFI